MKSNITSDDWLKRLVTLPVGCADVMFQENEIAKLRRRLDESEARCTEVVDENSELKREASILTLSPFVFRMRRVGVARQGRSQEFVNGATSSRSVGRNSSAGSSGRASVEIWRRSFQKLKTNVHVDFENK